MPNIDKSRLALRVARVVNRLPPIPAHIEQILCIEHEPRCERSKVLAVIKQDPGLSADMLHLANEYADKSEKSETIDEAFAHVGVTPITQLVRVCYTQNTIRQHFKALKCLEEYFTHCRDISRSCRALAQTAGISPHDRDLYTTAGLIHDIGRLAILLASDRFNAPLIGTTVKKMATIDHDERRLLGLDHCEVGWQICRRWNFSDVLQEAVLRHHTPVKENTFSFPGAFVFLAHFVSHSDVSGNILSKMLPHELLAPMNLTIENLVAARKMLRLEP